MLQGNKSGSIQNLRFLSCCIYDQRTNMLRRDCTSKQRFDMNILFEKVDILALDRFRFHQLVFSSSIQDRSPIDVWREIFIKASFFTESNK